MDERLGIAGRYSPQARRLICLAGGSWSYDLASRRLAEFCGLSVSDTTIRELSQQHGALANQWLREDPAAAREFRAATGDVEFTSDGTCVNTTDGWREMKVGLFSKRRRGASAVSLPAGNQQAGYRAPGGFRFHRSGGGVCVPILSGRTAVGMVGGHGVRVRFHDSSVVDRKPGAVAAHAVDAAAGGHARYHRRECSREPRPR